ncbi:MAG: SDR family oxidoreductase, partial [Actinobacteria bacterium]|nr:SDR family oxidoreductase [Actinomycetota bacterium]
MGEGRRSTARPFALVTGASSGIGAELARLAARDGYDLLLVARRGDRLAALADDLSRAHGVDARVTTADLATREGVRAVERALSGAPVEVLVNNAGFGGRGRFAVERDLAADLAMVELNVTSLVHLTGLVLPGMVQRGSGGVLNVASTAGYAPGPLQAVYYATKAFVKSFSEALTEECRGTGVRVTALCPGPVDTEFAAVAGLVGTSLMRTPLLKVPVEKVAEIGWDALRRGRSVVVPGLPLRVAMQGLRVTPR